MAGYSGTALHTKLGIAAGDLVIFSREPDAFRGTLGELPDRVNVRSRVSVPRSAKARRPDMTEDVVRGVGVALGMVDNKVCAIDETWSGLRLVYRLTDRAAVTVRREAPGVSASARGPGTRPRS